MGPGSRPGRRRWLPCDTISNATPHSRGAMRPRFASTSRPFRKEGAGKAGRRLRPRSWVTAYTCPPGGPSSLAPVVLASGAIYPLHDRDLLSAPNSASQWKSAIKDRWWARREGRALPTPTLLAPTQRQDLLRGTQMRLVDHLAVDVDHAGGRVVVEGLDDPLRPGDFLVGRQEG